MSNDDLHHTSDDPARVHSSDAWEDVSQVDIPELSDFGVLPGAADLPELPQLPELDALREPAMPEIVMPDLAMPDLNQFLAVTPPAPADISQPDAATTASPRKAPTGAQAPRPTITFEPTPARPPRASVPPRQKKPHLLIAFVALIAIAFGASFLSSTRDGSSSTPWGTQTSSSASTQADSEVREYAEGLPPRWPGYRGSATNTHSISPQWASGVATAWTLELPAEMTQFGPHMFVDGQVLYIAGYDTIEGQRGSAVRTLAYDLSGEDPALLWDTVGPTANSAIMTYTPAFVSSETQLFFHDVVIDKATGEQTQAPWGDDFPLAQADGIVVTCSTTSS